MDEYSVPRFIPGTRLRHDRVRDRWFVLAPEKVFMLDEVAFEVLRLVDGRSTLGEIIDALETRFDAPRRVLIDDVFEMLRNLSAQRVLTA